MNTNQIIELSKKLAADELDIFVKKNSDYANNDLNALGNFFFVEEIGVCPAEIGVLVRISDKFKRIVNLVQKQINGSDPCVVTESIEDTIMDIRNYFVILTAILNEKHLKSDI